MLVQIIFGQNEKIFPHGGQQNFMKFTWVIAFIIYYSPLRPFEIIFMRCCENRVWIFRQWFTHMRAFALKSMGKWWSKSWTNFVTSENELASDIVMEMEQNYRILYFKNKTFWKLNFRLIICILIVVGSRQIFGIRFHSIWYWKARYQSIYL